MLGKRELLFLLSITHVYVVSTWRDFLLLLMLRIRCAQGGTLIFYIYIGLADFLGVKILKFSIFGGFRKKSLFFGVVSCLWIFLGVCSLIDYFLGSFLISKYFLGGFIISWLIYFCC